MEPKHHKKKKTTLTDSLTSVPEPLPIIDQDYKKLQLSKQLNNEQVGLLLNIESYLSEYLDDFIVLGHSINGLRVAITHAKTPKDMDSLEQLYTDNFILMKNNKLNGEV